MPNFIYVALDARGRESSGLIEAASQNEAVSTLRRAGYFPKSLLEEGKSRKAKTRAKKETDSPKAFAGKAVKARTLMIFTRQLATLIGAGLPLLRGLTVLAYQERDRILRKVITNIVESVQGGETFSESLSRHPKIFNKLFVNMVKVGELGGVLELVLLRLAEFQEKAQKLKNKMRAAMVYPVLVLLIAIGILCFLLGVIIPKFQSIFYDMLGENPLPPLTNFVLGASNLLKENFLIVIGMLLVFFVALRFATHTTKGHYLIDALALKLPILGKLIRQSAIARFSRTLGTLVSSGVPILQALLITKETAGNRIIASAITKVHDSIQAGEPIVYPLEASNVFPPMVTSMIHVGEESGQLSEMLLKIADIYDDEVDNAIAGLTSLLEPMMIVFLAFVVGMIVIALFLPLISIASNLSDQ